MGAVSALTSPHNWYRNGELTQQEAADAFADIMDTAYALSEVGASCPSGVPTPFWDTVTDSDDEYPPGELTPWYGVAIVTYASPPEVTFIEQLGIWTIAGFIAYSGQIGGAIAFLTIAPQFVIAFKTGDVGALIDLIVDSSRVGRYDTHSDTPGILRVPVHGDPDLEEHQIYIVKADDDPDTVVQVVRDELNPNDVSPSNRRYNPETDEVEIQNPDGTWTPNDGADPRTDDGGQYAPPVADDVRCQAAANMARWYENLIDETLVNIGSATGASGLVTLLIGALQILGPFAILIDLIFGVALILFDAGSLAISAAFTSEVYDQLTCIFFNAIDENGVANSAALAAIKSEIDSSIGGLVATVMDAMLFLQGNVGLTNTGAVGMAPSDCSACSGWCITCDFTLSDGGFNTFFGEDYGVYSPGVGWIATDTSIGADRTIIEGQAPLGATFHVTKAEMIYDSVYSECSEPGSSGTGIGYGSSGNGFEFTNTNGSQDVATGTDLVWTFIEAHDVDTISFENQVAFQCHAGSSTIKRYTLWGDGDAPVLVGWDAC